MPLTETSCNTAKKEDRPYKLFDGGGLYLYVTPNGSKLWRLKYRYLGKEKILSIGSYNSVTLKQARRKREEAKELLAKKIDPSLEKQIQVLKETQRAIKAHDELRELLKKVKILSKKTI